MRVLTFAQRSRRGFRSSGAWRCGNGHKNPDVSTQRSVLIFSDVSSLEDACITLSWKGGNLLLIDAGRIPGGQILSIVSILSNGAICIKCIAIYIYIVIYSFFYVECIILNYWLEVAVWVARQMMCVCLSPNKFHPRKGREYTDGEEGYSASFSLASALHGVGDQRLASATLPPEMTRYQEPGSSVGIATRYGLGGPGIESRCGARFSAPIQTGPGALPSLLYNGYPVFPGGKAAGAWRWSSTASSAEVQGRVRLYIYSPSGPSWPVLRRILFLMTLYLL